MKRGEIWLINLDPTVGAEISKKRPALIVNENGMGKLPLRIIAPITAWRPHYRLADWMVKVDAGEPSNLDKDSSVDTFQIRSIDEKRMISRIGCLTEAQLDTVERSMKTVLAIDV